MAVLGVKDPLPITRATSADRPTVLDGDADGVMDASAVGLLDPKRVLLFSGSYAKDPKALREQVARDATLVVTDTNRKRSHRWTGARDNSGHTEQVDEKPLKVDQRDARLELFPGSGTDQQTVAEQRGVKVVEASDYGLAGLAPQPGFRAVRAVDGDPKTAWEVGGDLKDVEGQSIRIVAEHPITTDHVNLLQPIRGPRGRWIDTATLTFDGKDPVQVKLDRAVARRVGGRPDDHVPEAHVHDVPAADRRRAPEAELAVEDLGEAGRLGALERLVRRPRRRSGSVTTHRARRISPSTSTSACPPTCSARSARPRSTIPWC